MIEIHHIPEILDRAQLRALSSNPRLVPNTSIVYIYYLNQRKVNYPLADSNILYIGEVCRTNEPTGNRFAQHISTGAQRGADMGNNLTLSQYFYAGHSIGLKIFETNNRHERERDLIYSHINLFGSPPIAQNKVPSCPPLNGNRITHIFNHISNNPVELEEASNFILQINRQII